MRVGSLVFATDQGIGIIAKGMYDHGIITDPLIVRHGAHPTHEEWYGPDGPAVAATRSAIASLGRSVCDCVDTMFFIETPFDWSLIDYCRSRGVRTVLLTMYECTPERLPAVPDAFICPSLLDLQVFKGIIERLALADQVFRGPRYWQDRLFHIPIPTEVPWRQRTKAEVFVHNAGHGGLRGRNGTRELLEAMEFVQSPITLILRSQAPMQMPVFQKMVPWRMQQRTGYSIPYESLFQEGDVFVFPEKFAGDSMPLAEARAAGMLVMATDRFPMNTWLPRDVEVPATRAYDDGSGVVARGCQFLNPLIPVQNYIKAKVNRTFNEFDEAQVDPRVIAAKIDEWYGRDITEYSLSGREWAKTVSWEALKPRYLGVLSPR